MNSTILLFGLFMHVLLLVCFAHKHAEKNLSDHFFASIKSFQYVRLIQYEDFGHKRRIFSMSTKINGSSVKFQAKAYFSLIVDNNSYDLDLVLNNDLISRSYGITTYSKFGKHTSNDSQGKTCSYYQGSIRHTEDSKVFVSMCRGFRAIFILPIGVFNVEPLDNDTNVYKFYQSEISHFDDYFCSEFTHSLNDSFHFNSKQTNVQPQLKKQTLKTNDEFAYVELVLIASKSTCDALSGDRDDIEDYLKTVSNVVDGYYQEMKVHVVLVHIELWLEQDYFQTNSSTRESMLSFIVLRNSRIGQNPYSYWKTADAIHVIHDWQLESNKRLHADGVSTLNQICTTSASGISRYKTNPAFTAVALTHELGHNFGLIHVNDGKQTCSCKIGQCIMSPSRTYSLPQVWSECSLNYLKERFAIGAYDCLSKIPQSTSLVLGPGCGNTIIEVGEQCDCGFRPNCESQCCNPDHCLFLPNAECDTGACCKNCQLSTTEVICREKSDECDLPDFCSGTSPDCPQNIYKEDGTSCLNGQAYCVKGACVTRDVLCQKLHGPFSHAYDHCYTVNTYGRKGGNCGLDPNSETGYKVCATDDLFCGKLLCSGRRIIVTDFKVFDWLSTSCYTLVMAEGMPSQAVGLVPDGTVCGTNMACQNHHCQTVAFISQCNPPCIEGVCDNFGYCRCRNGELCVELPNGPDLPPEMVLTGTQIFILFTPVIFFVIVISLTIAYVKLRVIKRRRAAYRRMF